MDSPTLPTMWHMAMQNWCSERSLWVSLHASASLVKHDFKSYFIQPGKLLPSAHAVEREYRSVLNICSHVICKCGHVIYKWWSCDLKMIVMWSASDCHVICKILVIWQQVISLQGHDSNSKGRGSYSWIAVTVWRWRVSQAHMLQSISCEFWTVGLCDTDFCVGSDAC